MLVGYDIIFLRWSDMEIRVLRYFLAVAKTENITRAAELLHISQPSLSRQMMDLETEIGKPLFLRGKRKLTLTQAGIFLRKRAEEIVALSEQTERELRQGSGQPAGEVSVGGNPTAFLLRVITDLSRHYPRLRFRFYSSDADDISERLDHGSLDFAVLFRPVNAAKYQSVDLPDTTHWGLLLPADSDLARKAVLTRKDILDAPLILHRRAELQGMIADWARTDIERFHIAATYNVINGDPARFVQCGLGYLMTTDDHLPHPLDASLVFRPLYPLLNIRYVLAWKRQTITTAAASVFLEDLKEKVSRLQEETEKSI